MEMKSERRQTYDYADLFRFISKNTQLQQKIDEVCTHFDLMALSNIIAKGCYDHALLRHPDTPYACLKLFQLGKISSAQDATLFLYCLAAKSDKTFRNIRPQAIFAANGGLSEYAQSFMQHRVKPYFVHMQKHFELTELAARLKRLPLSEQVLFELDFLPDTDFTAILKQVRDFMGPIISVKNTHTAFLPSIGFLHSIFDATHETPVSLYGFFGQIQPYTRYHLIRTEHCMPLGRYEALVASSLVEAHGWIHDVFAIAFHDMLHWYWCNLLTTAEREEVFSYTDVLTQYYGKANMELVSQAPVLVHFGKKTLESLWDFQNSFTLTDRENRARQYLEDQAKDQKEYPIFQDWHPLQEAIQWEKTYQKLAEKAPDPQLFRRVFPYRQGVLDAYRKSQGMQPGVAIAANAQLDATILTSCFEQLRALSKQHGMSWLIFWFICSHNIPHDYAPFLEYICETLCAYSTISQLNSIGFPPNTILPNQKSYMEALVEALEHCKDVLSDTDYCLEILQLLDRYQYGTAHTDYILPGSMLQLILHADSVQEQDFPYLAKHLIRHIHLGVEHQIKPRTIFSFVPECANPNQLNFWQYFFKKNPEALTWNILCEKIEKAARHYEIQQLIDVLAPPAPKPTLHFFHPALTGEQENSKTNSLTKNFL